PRAAPYRGRGPAGAGGGAAAVGLAGAARRASQRGRAGGFRVPPARTLPGGARRRAPAGQRRGAVDPVQPRGPRRFLDLARRPLGCLPGGRRPRRGALGTARAGRGGARPVLATGPDDPVGEGMPVLRLGYRSEVLVFLAQGQPPYTLAAGSARRRRGEAPIKPLLDA